MSFTNWKDAASGLERILGKATEKQVRLAEVAGVMLSPQTPRMVAAAMLKVALRGDLDLAMPRPVMDWHREAIEDLLRSHDVRFSPGNDVEAAAWVRYLRLSRRREHIRRLELNEDDVVETDRGDLALVSSISEDGCVYFKGAVGFRSWPDLIEVVHRATETSREADEARRKAANNATLRAKRAYWSAAKSADLAEFATDGAVCEHDIAELESVIDGAQDERPIQEHLEVHPHLLTFILGGTERFCIPQKQLGADYVPDFIIGDTNSLGVRWVLVELETPRSGVYLKKGKSLDEHARSGIDQVCHWRDWLTDNISHARKRRAENGLGLFDICPKPPAVVLVGRRHLMTGQGKDALRRQWRESGIDVHTYDWLLEQLRGALRHQGPPATNPLLVARDTDG